MPITFTCECGEQISVPDGMEGRIALCARCRKTQRIPDGSSEEDDSSVSGLFREALAAFGEGAEGQGAGAAETEPPSEADTRVMEGRKASDVTGPPGEPPSAVKAALEGPPGPGPDAAPAPSPGAPADAPKVVPDPDEIDFAEEIDFSEAPEGPGAADTSEDAHATGEVRPAASASRDDARPGERRRKRAAGASSPDASSPRASSSDDEGGPATKDAIPVEYAAKVLERREIEKAIRREGEPDSPAGAFEPKDIELHGNVMKFHCRCGKRISVPVDATKTIGRCPKCGARLVVPKVSQAKLPIPEPEPEPEPKPGPPASKDAAAKSAPKKRPNHGKKKARSDEARAENVRRATAEVADRLRKRGAPKGKGKGASPGSRGGLVRASGPARVLAAAADAALTGAALVGSFYVLGGGAWTAGGVVPAAVLGGAAWCANRLIVQWIFGSSIGMMAGGVRLARPDGRPLSFGGNLVRAFAGLLLVPLAPVAIWDKGRRTPADRAAGTVVLSNR